MTQLQKVEAAESPKLAAHQDAIFLNPKLFARVDAIYQKRDTLHLDPESRQLLEIYHLQFVQAGAMLAPSDKEKLKDLNKQISTLQTAFEQKLLAAAKAGGLVVANKADLAGLSDDAIAAAAKAAEARGLKGKWVLPLQNTTQQPSLQSLANRATREKLFNNGWTRAEKDDANDTRATISTLAHLRAMKAKLLGYPDYADLCAAGPDGEDARCCREVLSPTHSRRRLPKARREAKVLQAQIDKDGQHFQLKPWDWEPLCGRRCARHNTISTKIRSSPISSSTTCSQNGVFYAANQLYGLTFKERHDLPV